MEKNTQEKQEVLRVALYLRVSTEDQSKSWYWLEYQEHDLKKLIEYRSTLSPKWVTKDEWLFVDWWYSWWDLNRPAFKKLMEKARNKEFDLVAVWKIDRLSRNLTHLLKTFEELKDHWVSFFSLKENIDFSWAIWKLTFQIFWALSEFERNMIKTRTTEWKMASARAWNYIWNWIPYWYDKIPNEWWKWSKLKKIKKEAIIVKRIFFLFIYEGFSPGDIAKELNKLRIIKWKNAKKDAVNTKWNETTVKRMLKNFTYCWYRTESFKQEDGSTIYIDIPVDEIIKEELFIAAKQRLEELDQTWITKSSDNNKVYLLTWKIFDIDTQKYFYGMLRTKDNKLTYRRDKYTTKEWKIYWNIEFPWEDLEKYVWNEILNLINNPEKFHEEYLLETEKWWNIADIKEELDIIVQNIKSEEIFQENVDRDYYKWWISEEKRDKYLEESNLKIKKLLKEQEAQEKILNNISKIVVWLDVLKKISEQYMWKVDKISFKEKRRIIDILVQRILVKKITTDKVVYLDEQNELNDNTDKSIKIDIFFRFEAKKVEENIESPELSKGIKNQKNTTKDAVNDVIGRRRETRTHNPTLPKRVR